MVEAEIQHQENQLAQQEEARRAVQENPDVAALWFLIFLIPVGVILYILNQAFFH